MLDKYDEITRAQDFYIKVIARYIEILDKNHNNTYGQREMSKINYINRGPLSDHNSFTKR